MPAEQQTDEDFAARLRTDSAKFKSFITIEYVDGTFSGYHVLFVQRKQYRETRFLLRPFVGPAADRLTEYGERAREYADAACDFFGVELREA